MGVSGVETAGATRLQADVRGTVLEESANRGADFIGGPAGCFADTEQEIGTEAGVTSWETSAVGPEAGIAVGTGLLMGPGVGAKGVPGFTGDSAGDSGLRAGSAEDTRGATGTEMCAKGGITYFAAGTAGETGGFKGTNSGANDPGASPVGDIRGDPRHTVEAKGQEVGTTGSKLGSKVEAACCWTGPIGGPAGVTGLDAGTRESPGL